MVFSRDLVLYYMLGGAFFLLTIYFFLDILLTIKKQKFNLIYSGKQDEPVLYSKSFDEFIISGKPDEIYQTKTDDLFIKEYKSFINPIQMGAYFIVTESEFGKRPLYGIIHNLKTKKEIRIENSDLLRKEVLFLSKEILLIKQNRLLPARNHDEPKKCMSCKYYSICKDAVKT